MTAAVILNEVKDLLFLILLLISKNTPARASP